MKRVLFNIFFLYKALTRLVAISKLCTTTFWNSQSEHSRWWTWTLIRRPPSQTLTQNGPKVLCRDGKMWLHLPHLSPTVVPVFGAQHVCPVVPYKTFRLILNAGEKMYSKQTVYDAHLTSKKHVKATAKQAASASGPPANPNGPPDGTVLTTTAPSAPAKHRTAALLTSLSAALLVTLVPALNDTKANVERRFSLTAREREQELIEQQQRKAAPATTKTDGAEGEGEDDEEERIYNPLKLPLGWDGKPIPYWLYKLHGLGVEYRCEICSDHVYMGRSVHHITRFVAQSHTSPLQEKL
jgi:hypothetical protein